jgi:hypothetical protein
MSDVDFPTVGEQLRRIDDRHSVAGTFCFRVARPGDVMPTSVKIVLHLPIP